jgi:hypothetical protein
MPADFASWRGSILHRVQNALDLLESIDGEDPTSFNVPLTVFYIGAELAELRPLLDSPPNPLASKPMLALRRLDELCADLPVTYDEATETFRFPQNGELGNFVDKIATPEGVERLRRVLALLNSDSKTTSPPSQGLTHEHAATIHQNEDPLPLTMPLPSAAPDPPKASTDSLVAEFLRSKPNATSAQIGLRLGKHNQTIRATNAWKMRKKANRQTPEQDREISTTALSREILAVVPSSGDNPADIAAERDDLDKEQFVEPIEVTKLRYIDGANRAQRAKFHNLSAADQVNELIAWKLTGERQ